MCESTYGKLAQLVEQLTLNQWVNGSNPLFPIQICIAVGLEINRLRE